MKPNTKSVALTLYAPSAIKISSRPRLISGYAGAYSTVAQWQSIRLLTGGL